MLVYFFSYIQHNEPSGVSGSESCLLVFIFTPMDKPLRILHIADRLSVGGAERIVVTQVTLLHQSHVNVSVLTTVEPGTLADDLPEKVQHIQLNREYKWNISAMYRLANTLQKFDIVHVHGYHTMRFVWLSNLLFGKREKKWVYQEHSGKYVGGFSASKEMKWILRNIRYIAVSSAATYWAEQHLKLPRKNIHQLSNIIIRQEVKQRLLHSNRLEVVVVSNFVPLKNIEKSLHIFQLLQEKFSYARLTIIGQINDQSYYDSICNLIEQLKIADAVQIKTDSKNIQEILHEFDLALHTSTYESGPLVLMEYLAQGLPFLSTKQGEIALQVQTYLPEMIIEDRKIENWIAAVDFLLKQNDYELNKRMKKAFATLNNTESYIAQLTDIYKMAMQ